MKTLGTGSGVAGALLAVALLGGCGWLGRGAPQPPAVPVALVAEMEPIAGVDGGKPCGPGEFAEDVAKALTDWAGKRRSVQRLITAQRVRELSRWALKQMAAYRRVPPLQAVAFKPIAHHAEARRLVLEGVVDTLPSHSPLVTRWLKVYLLYDCEKQVVVKVAVTIRGELLE